MYVFIIIIVVVVVAIITKNYIKYEINYDSKLFIIIIIKY
jgi:hypothetical protein